VYGTGTGDAVPYFFLSYAHTPRQEGDLGDPDIWVKKLFRDLSTEVRRIVGLPSSARAAFMDREPRTGSEWSSQLAHALATCRVFVPLYSNRYFDSERCGKEWSAFSRRARHRMAHNAGFTEAIVPALWVPVPPAALSEAARSVQFDHRRFGPLYSQLGFYGIIKISRYEREYEQAVCKLAQRILEVAQNVYIDPEQPERYGALKSVHDPAGRRKPVTRRLRITMVALAKSDLPAGRTGQYYGSAACDWNPYDSALPLANFAADLARGLGYQPDVGDLNEHLGALLDSTQDPGPGVLIVDAWATTQAECQQTLSQIDALGTPWTQVVVPWNRQDAGTLEAEPRLRNCLEAALRKKLVAGYVDSRDAVDGVPGMAEFDVALRAVIQAAARQYLRHGQAYPPSGQAIERPRLIGPVTDPSSPENFDERNQ
jgi:FxsC-like protein